MTIVTVTIPRAISFATPGLTLTTANAGGSAGTAIRSDSSLLAYDATVPTTQAFGDSAAVGSAVVASRRDHLHGMMETVGPTIVEVYATGNETIAYGVHEILDWDAAQIQLLIGSSDTTQWTAGAASKLFCKSAGIYVVTAFVTWNTLAAGSGEINLKLWKNKDDSGGTIAVDGSQAVHNGRLGQQLTRTVNLVVDDYMQVGVYHSSNDGSGNVDRIIESFSDTGTPVVRNSPFFAMYKL